MLFGFRPFRTRDAVDVRRGFTSLLIYAYSYGALAVAGLWPIRLGACGNVQPAEHNLSFLKKSRALPFFFWAGVAAASLHGCQPSTPPLNLRAQRAISCHKYRSFSIRNSPPTPFFGSKFRCAWHDTGKGVFCMACDIRYTGLGLVRESAGPTMIRWIFVSQVHFLF